MTRVLALVMILSGIAACGGVAGKSPSLSPEEALRLRAESYWNARKAKDWKTVRTFVHPESLPNLEDYFKKHEQASDLSTIDSFKIQGVTVDGNEGRTVTVVSLVLTHPLLGGKPYPLRQTVEDSWVYREGLWYVLINPPNMEDLLRKFQKKPEAPTLGG